MFLSESTFYIAINIDRMSLWHLNMEDARQVIQAEDYDLGGQEISYFDTSKNNSGGQYRADDVDIWRYGPDTFYLGSNAAGEWLKYTIGIPVTDDYWITLRASTPYSDRFVHFELNGVDVTGPIHLLNTGGWTNWKWTSTTAVHLEMGRQEMRLVIDSGGLNIDQILLRPVVK